MSGQKFECASCGYYRLIPSKEAGEKVYECLACHRLTFFTDIPTLNHPAPTEIEKPEIKEDPKPEIKTDEKPLDSVEMEMTREDNRNYPGNILAFFYLLGLAWVILSANPVLWLMVITIIYLIVYSGSYLNNNQNMTFGDYVVLVALFVSIGLGIFFFWGTFGNALLNIIIGGSLGFLGGALLMAIGLMFNSSVST